MTSPIKQVDPFVMQYTSHDTDTLVNKATNGVRSNKYKAVDYDKLRLLAAEKKFAAHKSLLKVKKIEQLSKQTKENNLLKQHKLVWNKELIRLNNLRKRLQSDIDVHRGVNLTPGNTCCSLFEDFEDFEASLDVEFAKFKASTTQPVWNLREDLQYWLQENMEDLRMGSPDTVQKHNEIQCTIDNVKGQQKKVLEKLHHQQICLEQELGMGFLGTITQNEDSQKVHVESGIPEEAYDLECSDFDLKVSVLQEFIIMDEKFRERLKYLEEEHSKILKLGRNGGWSDDDHYIFTVIYEQYPHEMKNRRKMIIDRLQRHLPKKLRADLVSHEEWCDSNKYFRERKKALMVAWQKGRSALYHKAESIFTEAEMAAQLEEVKAEYNRKQRQVREVLHEKIRNFREQQMEALIIQHKMESEKLQAVRERLKMEAELETKKRTHEKEQVAKFHEEIEKKQQKQSEKDQKRYDELQAQLAEQAKFDQERIKYRAEQLDAKIEERKYLKEEKRQAEIEKEERLEALREQVRVVAESDPHRILQETEAWQNRYAENEDDIDIQKPLFNVIGFTSKQITSDPRMKLEARLRDAGLHNTDYARQIMSKVQPPQPPRRDMESTVFKKT
ncbi:coiled-coil domain-containing protein 148-like [Mytilus californianus]|uniref:coiled-coil domain-containing protein 148-like n=1 Tax=Mytilus californianus TaxID=6549 RepID=UPI0022481773|nr:coiled-coil domain-containing protein 148-like [Mytilus californianus]XP_052094947.1 coiled-coil domain-containing protein 148-like [Mytilus californianus]XP_052094948.1 coiled-coil domain-containing protein 148-like [Mytilus californianus]XP_052094949.1 coiled-coil domain-containing protein 148-like [Mytilus californianus]